nr:DUF3623 family protein [Oceanococcus sp. HetDA_MAG_MS8]
MWLAIICAVLSWWLSTGVIVYLNLQGAHSRYLSFAAATFIAGLALWAAHWTAADSSIMATYLGFACGLALWGWQIMSYFMGYITGPVKAPLRQGSSPGSRFAQGLGTSLHHELVILALAAALAIVSWGQANPTALYTYLILWSMHTSAKLNMFLGVRNLYLEFLPARLSYLRSYLRRRRGNWLLPLSLLLGLLGTTALIQMAMQAAPSSAAMVQASLLATLLGLATLEHVMLVIPLRVSALWDWSVPAAET